MRKNGMKGKSGRERDELELEVDMERLGEQGEQRGVRTYFQAFADEFLDILFGENDPFFREEEEYEREAFGIVGGLACGARLEAEFPPGRYGRLQRKLEGLEGKGE